MGCTNKTHTAKKIPVKRKAKTQIKKKTYAAKKKK